MRIHTDHNGVYVNAIFRLADGTDVVGHQYQLAAGANVSTLDFQRGPVKDVGVNGITNEALLAVLIHRMKYLDGQFGCDENKRAIQHLEEALVNLEVRTARRMVRGVEGTARA